MSASNRPTPRCARDVMDAAPKTVLPTLSVKELAAILLAERLDGVCVAEEGRLLGVVTSMDLIFQEQPVHLPSFFVFLDAVIPLESPSRVEHELAKLAGAQVKDIMVKHVVTVNPDHPLEAIAKQMVQRHISVIPVVDQGKLVGVITKPAMLRAAFQWPVTPDEH